MSTTNSPWPDLVLIDGGLGQLNAAREVLAGLGAEVPLAAIAKGPDRDAGRETFFLPGRDSFKLPPRDPVLYFVERLRDEAHRFAVGSHRTRRARDMREAGLQEIAGIGPTRKRALLHPLRHAESHRACRGHRPDAGRRHQCRNGAADLRIFSRGGGLKDRTAAMRKSKVPLGASRSDALTCAPWVSQPSSGGAMVRP